MTRIRYTTPARSQGEVYTQRPDGFYCGLRVACTEAPMKATGPSPHPHPSVCGRRGRRGRHGRGCDAA